VFAGAVRAARALFILLVFLAAPALAQEQGAGAPADTGAGLPPSAQALLDVLRDPEARDALVAELERLGPAEAPVEEAAAAAESDEPVSFGRRAALLTQSVAEGLAANLREAWTGLQRAPRLFTSLGEREFAVLGSALADLAAVILVTVAVFFTLRRFARPYYVRAGDRARGAPAARVALAFAGTGLMDFGAVVLAWLAGYALAIAALNEFGQIGIRQTLYLNAFLLVETVKVGTRLLLSPSTPHLRVLPLGDAVARYLARRVNVIVGVLGYGQLLAVPILNQNLSFAAGRSLSALLAFLVLGYLVYLVLKNRRPVAEWMIGESETGGPRTSLRTLAKSWHWFALVYLAVMLFIVLTRPGPVVFDALTGSAQVVLAVIAGIVVSNGVTRAIERGLVLPERVNTSIPLLESRLNQAMRRVLAAARLVVVGLVALLAADILGLIDLRGWLSSQLGLRLSGIVFSVAFVLLAAFAGWLALSSWVDYRLNPEVGRAPSAREATLLSLFRNAATIVLIVLTAMFVLAEVGLDIGPLLASAGVLGLAIGFGAQKLVQDIITGVFIQLENAMNVGDVVTVGGVSGAVERLTIRSVGIRDIEGSYHIIPFSSVDMVKNFMRDFAYFVCDMGVAYREDVDEAKQAMFDGFEELRADPAFARDILGDLEWFGLNAFGDSAIVLRARIKTRPGKQWGVGRAYNLILKRLFDERGIEIPFPHQTIYFGEAKDGRTQRLRVANAPEPARPAEPDEERG
jgi:small-conductance mechanosensitive channel